MHLKAAQGRPNHHCCRKSSSGLRGEFYHMFPRYDKSYICDVIQGVIQFAHLIRIASSSKAMVSLMKTVQLGVIKETSSTISAPKEARKPWERSVISATKAPSATRSSSRGRRPTTIPKEPNFHSIHTPKSCTKKLA